VNDTVRISNYNAGLPPILIAAAVAVGMIVFIVIASLGLGDTKTMSFWELAGMCAVWSVFIAVFGYKGFAACLWLEFGERIRVRTLRGVRAYDWSEVTDWGFETETSRVRGIPIGEHLMFVIVFSKKSYSVKVSAAEAKSLEAGLSGNTELD